MIYTILFCATVFVLKFDRTEDKPRALMRIAFSPNSTHRINSRKNQTKNVDLSRVRMAPGVAAGAKVTIENSGSLLRVFWVQAKAIALLPSQMLEIIGFTLSPDPKSEIGKGTIAIDQLSFNVSPALP